MRSIFERICKKRFWTFHKNFESSRNDIIYSSLYLFMTQNFFGFDPLDPRRLYEDKVAATCLFGLLVVQICQR